MVRNIVLGIGAEERGEEDVKKNCLKERIFKDLYDLGPNDLKDVYAIFELHADKRVVMDPKCPEYIHFPKSDLLDPIRLRC